MASTVYKRQTGRLNRLNKQTLGQELILGAVCRIKCHVVSWNLVVGTWENAGLEGSRGNFNLPNLSEFEEMRLG